ncbi:MAG: gliding motility-associated C-terminal domain-containing protein, partial [Bacteroidota bacterium]
QLAPDGKIYFTKNAGNITSVGTINCPNSTAPSITYDVFLYNDLFFSLPNFPSWIFYSSFQDYMDLGQDTVYLCPGDSIILNAGAGVSWSWGGQSISGVPVSNFSQFYTVTEPGVYSATVFGECNSGASDQIIVLPGQNAVGLISSEIDSCTQNAIPFSFITNTPVTDIIWDFDDPGSGTNNTSGALNPIHVFSSPGTYNIMAIVSFPCSVDTLYQTISINTAIATQISVSQCVSFTAPWGTTYTQSGIYTDTLISVSGCDSILTLNLIITGSVFAPTLTVASCTDYISPWGTIYTQSGFYSDTLLTVNGCDSIVSVNLTITGAITTSPITASACTSYNSTWGTVYTQSGLYTDTLSTVNGCDSIVSVNLTITGLPVLNAAVSADTCGLGVGSAAVLASGGTGGYSYVWSNGSTNNALSNLGGGTYTVTVTDQGGCTSSTQVLVTSIAPIPITVSASALNVTQGDSVSLIASGGVSYQWSPSAGLSCVSCGNPIATPSQTTTYTVEGTDANGCTTTASITIEVDVKCSELFVPSVFSPDGRGPQSNEQVCVFSNCISLMDFAIYNKWGQLVFQTKDPGACWDGTFNGKDPEVGVYAYRLYVKQLDGLEIKKNGNISLIR